LVGKVGLLHRLVLVASVVILLVVAYYLLFPLNQYVVRLKVSTTTSLYATGLLEAIAEAFSREYPNVRLEFIAVGSGAALRIAERGDACVVLIHEPYLEHQYLMKGVIGGGRVFAYNYFVVVGPKNDPANISGVDNVLEVFRRVYVAGELGRTYFVSRGDNSGTHLRELMIWGLLGLNPGNTSWYRSCGCGMSDALLIANELGAYTLSDLGTYLKFKKGGKLQNLELLYINTDDNLTINIYSAYIASRCSGDERRYGELLINFISKDEGGVIRDYGVKEFGQPLFYPVLENESKFLSIWEWFAYR